MRMATGSWCASVGVLKIMFKVSLLEKSTSTVLVFRFVPFPFFSLFSSSWTLYSNGFQHLQS